MGRKKQSPSPYGPMVIGERPRGRQALAPAAASELARHLEAVRAHFDLTPGQFAERLRYPAGDPDAVERVRSWMRPANPITPELPRLVQIAREFGVSLDYLLVGREPMLLRDPVPDGQKLPDLLRAELMEDLAARGDYDRGVLGTVLPSPDELWKLIARAVHQGFGKGKGQARRLTRFATVIGGDIAALVGDGLADRERVRRLSPEVEQAFHEAVLEENRITELQRSQDSGANPVDRHGK